MKKIHLIGSASDLAGANTGSRQGPRVLQHSSYLSSLRIPFQWDAIFETSYSQPKLKSISAHCQKIANLTYHLTVEKKFFIVFGGDHSSAIGTWSGVYYALKKKGPLGLIWIDAHMDSHTPETSSTGNIHGMPLASLLGYGEKSLTQILDPDAKVKPSQVCLIGVRSFEPEEASLLKKLNVKVFYMEEVKERGLECIMKEALAIVTQGTAGFGISLDIDSINPEDAPGTGVPVSQGISAKELCHALEIMAHEPSFLGAEIVEFDPTRDIDHKTEKWISQLMHSLIIGSSHAVFKNPDCDTRNAAL